MEQLIIFVLVAIGVAIKNYFDSRAQKGGPPPTDTFGGPRTPPARTQAPPPAPPPRPGGSTPEEERMRKFFEALGLPADAVPPAPVAPAPKAPPTLPPPVPAPAPARSRPAPPPMPKPAPRPAPVLAEARSLDSDPSPQVLAGDMHRVDPKYESAKVTADFRGAARLDVSRPDVHVNVLPDLLGVAPPVVAVGTAHRTVSALPAAELVRSLRGDPAALRRALVLKEILDPPVALR
ncbi:MAG: hypothetical protein JSR82_21940 [Verrucomicrobia bacterium]|nr:hypothetical protein [Verrucomicrobiota bacterium]